MSYDKERNKAMTIDKSKTITLPVWLISVIISAFGSLILVWGIISAAKVKLELEAETSKNNIEILRKEKVDRNEFNIVIDRLVEIQTSLDKANNKLDSHIERSKN